MEKIKSNGPGRKKLERKKILAAGEARVAILRPTPGFRGGTAGSSEFAKEGREVAPWPQSISPT